ncbi:MAG: HAD-IA family hydrolase [Methyloprofundus sp.]|nr:HAD-IA family hydrolase [Methyloprofundus sp.]
MQKINHKFHIAIKTCLKIQPSIFGDLFMLFVFDMGGVLANSTCTENICSELGISTQEFYLFQRDSIGNNTYQALSIGTISPEEYWDNFSHNSGIQIQEDLFKLLYRPKIDNSILFLINKIKKTGCRVVCCTNTIKSHFEEHLRLGNYSAFDHIYSSHIMGVKKPSPEIFRRIIELERVAAGDVYFIDDDSRNVKVAQDLGFSVHLFVSAEILKEDLSHFSCKSCRSNGDKYTP